MTICTTEGLQLLAVATEIWNYNTPNTSGNTVGWVKTLAYIDGNGTTTSPASMSLYNYTFTTNPSPLNTNDYTSNLGPAIYSSAKNGLVYENFIVFVCYVSTANASPFSCIGNLNGSSVSAFSINSNEPSIFYSYHDNALDYTIHQGDGTLDYTIHQGDGTRDYTRFHDDNALDYTEFQEADLSNNSVIIFNNLAELGPNPQNAYAVFAFPLTNGIGDTMVDITIGSS